MLKRTPLFEVHRKLGARLVEFGGWEMPVQYTGIVDEHQTVRNAAGMFDISHMGELFVSGPGALEFLNSTLTNDAAKLSVGQGQYTILCNQKGGVIDDLYVYHTAEQEYLLIVNASRINADYAWLQECQRSAPPTRDATLENRSDALAAVAVQGPNVVRFIDACFNAPSTGGIAADKPTALKKNQLARFAFNDAEVWVSRTGYTGEDGFEIVSESGVIERIWNRLIEVGTPHGLKPAGLGARDTLRTEMCYPLYGHELDEETSPIEAGLGKFVAFDKGEFAGRAALLAQQSGSATKKCVAFVMTEKSAPPRPHYSIWSADGSTRLGEVVSGTQSPSMQVGIGLGYVPPAHAKAGNSLQIEIRGKHAAAMMVPKPIYKKPV